MFELKCSSSSLSADASSSKILLHADVLCLRTNLLNTSCRWHMDLSFYSHGANLSATPSLLPPRGVFSNFVNPLTRTNVTLIPCACIFAVMILFVALRIYTKMYIICSVGWDDCEIFCKLHHINLAYTRSEDVCVFAAVSRSLFISSSMVDLTAFLPCQPGSGDG